MRHAEPDQLQTAITSVIRGSKLAGHLTLVSLGPDEDARNDEFIRIIIKMSSLDDVSDDDVDRLTSLIESALTQLDDRFPSVRFSEP